MNRRTTTTSLIVVALFAGSLIGCRRLDQVRRAAEAARAAADGTGSRTEKPSKDSTEEDKDGALGEKLGKYIDCLNGVNKSVSSSRSRYLSWVNEKTGPTGKESSPHGLYTINQIDTCLASIDKAKNMTPPLPEIEAAGNEFKAALAELVPQVKRAYEYYDQKNYKDDQWQAGKAMHAPLMEAFDKFEKASTPFEEKVTRMNDELGLRNLARLERDNERRLEYLVAKTLQDAKKLMKQAEVRDLASLNAEAYNAGLETFEKTLADLDQYAEQHKAEANKATRLSSFIGDAKEYLKATKDLMRRKRDGKDFNKESLSNIHPESVEGHPARVVDKYNSMVRDSNYMRF